MIYGLHHVFLYRLSDAEIMEITHFERGSGLISTNNNNITVEFRCSDLEKSLITTDSRELQELIVRKQAENISSKHNAVDLVA